MKELKAQPEQKCKRAKKKALPINKRENIRTLVQKMPIGAQKNIVWIEPAPGFSFDRTSDLLFRQSGVHIQILEQTWAVAPDATRVRTKMTFSVFRQYNLSVDSAASF